MEINLTTGLNLSSYTSITWTVSDFVDTVCTVAGGDTNPLCYLYYDSSLHVNADPTLVA